MSITMSPRSLMSLAPLLEPHMLKISQPEHARLGKGAAIGAGVGALAGFLGLRQGSDCRQCLVGAMLVTVGGGAGVGALLQAAESRQSERLIFLK